MMAGRPKKIVGEQYSNTQELLMSLIEILQPPERLTVSQAAEKYRWLNNPGAYTGPFKTSKVAYTREVMDTLDSREHTACIFVAPAQSAKTEIILNWLTHGVICNPADMIIYQTANSVARDFSRRRIDRLHRHSKEVGKRLLPRGDADNTFDKFYRSGMMLTLSWPTINELSGRPVGRVALTDYDRMPLNIDNEGSAFDLGRKRTTTYGSAAMTFAESSPGYSVADHTWVPKTPHEAPPAPGIISLYNRGDRRLWYWKCWSCANWFEPKFAHMKWHESKDLVESSESAWLECPKCRAKIEQNYKQELNEGGLWLPDGMRIVDDRVVGEKKKSDIASFWLKGPAASFQRWESLVLNYLKAMQEYERTKDQNALRTTVNTDQGEPYYEKGVGNERSPEDLAALAEDYGTDEPSVPPEVRFITATIDVQKNSFEVQVQGVTAPFGDGTRSDHIVVDRFAIKKSKRKDDDGERYLVKPHAYAEDWDLITEQVLKKTYPVADGSGRRMAMRWVACDSGGKKGATGNAYAYWLRLRKEGLGAKLVLVKGTGSPAAPRTNLTYPDSNRKDRKAQARGEIPVLLIQTDKVKDELDSALERAEPGGMVRFSSVLPDTFYRELTVEVKDLRGRWDNPKKLRQESWDLLVYHLALCDHKKIEHINWEKPPLWAEEVDKNILVTKVKGEVPFETERKSDYSLRNLADALG